MATAGFRLPRFRGRLRSHLIALVLAPLVPMLIWAGGLLYWESHQERIAVERGLSDAARAMTLAVEQDIKLSIEALETIGLSRRLADGDYEDFYWRARQLAARHANWSNLLVIGRSGQMLVNSLIPYGQKRPSLDDPGFSEAQRVFEMVLATGRPAISGVFLGPVTGRYLVSLGVPVTGVDGEITHVLMAGILADQLGGLLNSQTGSSGNVVALLDGDDTVIARTIDHDRLVGKQAPEWFRAQTRGNIHGVVEGQSMHGPEYTFAYERSHFTGWTLVFGAPREAFLAARRQTALLTGGFGLAVLGISLLLATWVAARILRPVKQLTRMASPFIADGKPADAAYPVAELDALHNALDGLTEALSASETRFRQLFATAPVMLDVQDGDGRVIEVNEAWLNVLGYPRDRVIGRNFSEFVTQQSRAYFDDVVRPDLMRDGTVDDVPLQFITRSGEVRDVLMSARVETGPDCQTRRISALRDVTDQRRIEAALARAIDEARQANDAKTRFLATASHDLRQPLQALSLYVGVLKARFDAPVLLAAIGQCVDTLSALLNDMLDVARLDAGTITPKVEDAPVRDLLEQVAAAWRIQAENKGLSLHIVPCSAVVRTDPALMGRVLSNLVANAVRYTERGRLLVGCRVQHPDRIRIEVWDTGIGIPADKLGSIFAEFHQLGNPERRRDSGTGLGLAIVDRIARLLGHEVSVRSQPGRGSVFAVTVPMSGTSAQGCPVPEPSDEHVCRILVVEDESHVRNALEMMLTELGHRVAAADTIEGAIAKAEADCPHLVIADFRLGGSRTGIDAIRAIRHRCGTEMPAVILTADTDPVTIRHIVGQGMHLLHKPLQVETLRNFLRKVA